MSSLATKFYLQHICQSKFKIRKYPLPRVSLRLFKYKAHSTTVSLIHQRDACSNLKYGCKIKLFCGRKSDNLTNYQLLNHLKNAKTSHISLENGFKSSSVKYVHPVLLAWLKPVARIVPALAGRILRKWWRNLSEPEKLRLKQQRKQFASIVSVFCIITLAGLVYVYQTRTEHMDILGIQRKRFLPFSVKDVEQLADEQFYDLLMEYEDDFLKKSDPRYSYVTEVTNRLLDANLDVEGIHGKNWTVSVIESRDINAFVLPTGNIFVFTGMLNHCTNKDQLACVLGHEIAHVVLSHGAEQLGRTNLLSLLMTAPILLLWAILPTDLLAVFADLSLNKVAEILLELPYSRVMETEADLVGLELASKACFDIREAPVVWCRMQAIEEVNENIYGENYFQLPLFLSTHPSDAERQKCLSTFIPKALEKRSSCGCRKLTTTDPLVEYLDKKTQIIAAMKEEKMKRDKEIKQYEILKVLKVEEKPSAQCPDSLSNEDTIKLSEKKILWFLW